MLCLHAACKEMVSTGRIHSVAAIQCEMCQDPSEPAHAAHLGHVRYQGLVATHAKIFKQRPTKQAEEGSKLQASWLLVHRESRGQFSSSCTCAAERILINSVHATSCQQPLYCTGQAALRYGKRFGLRLAKTIHWPWPLQWCILPRRVAQTLPQ